MKIPSVNPSLSFAFGYFFTRNLTESQGLLSCNLLEREPASVGGA